MAGDKAISLEEIKNESVDLVYTYIYMLSFSLLSSAACVWFPGKKWLKRVTEKNYSNKNWSTWNFRDFCISIVSSSHSLWRFLLFFFSLAKKINLQLICCFFLIFFSVLYFYFIIFANFLTYQTVVDILSRRFRSLVAILQKLNKKIKTNKSSLFFRGWSAAGRFSFFESVISAMIIERRHTKNLFQAIRIVGAVCPRLLVGPDASLPWLLLQALFIFKKRLQFCFCFRKCF